MKKILSLLTAFVAMASLSSCLDEDPVFDASKSQNIIEIKYVGNKGATFPTGTIFPMYAFSFPIIQGAEEEIPVLINYGGPNVAPEDITVTIMNDPSALTEHNTKTGSKFVLLPESMYSIPSATITIPKGERTASLPVKVKPYLFNPALTYALAISISSASSGTVSTNFKTAILPLNAKNKYDGVYRVTNLVFNNVTAPLHTANSPRTRHLRTVDADSNELFDPALNGGTQGISFFNNGAGSLYGNFSPVFNFDLNTDNVTSVTNYFPVPNSSNRDAKLDPTGLNKMTIVSADQKTLEVSYIMTVNGVNTLYLKEKWEYTGPRP
ncbi:DUF1735 domain-containing protein [Rufibacter immobilis]|uniref:DUF1735 domain-containing protein n=1 Tax=Rufibacter immobilis TaxID=1348778 RepID=A0A3M9N785_9BACT|nr:DUF1735 domain-containing protein [Rufibacter immobilis]RNI33167.1 DUF1735 domain-containing protein [Rufibacter immobilis]